MEYYILINHKKQGPFTIEELKEKAIDAHTMVWRAGMTQWKMAGDIAELADLLKELPPVESESETPPMPKTWLVESILATLFCCLPLGVVGIVNAARVETAYYNNDLKQATERSNQAKKWTLWSAGVAIVGWGLYFVVNVHY